MSNNKQTLFIIVFLCSLVFNIFLGGFLVGNYLARGGPPGHRPPPPPPPRLEHGPLKAGPGLGIVQRLPEASQAKIAPLVQKQKNLMRPQKKKLKQAQRAVIDQLTAEPFNSPAFSEALTRLEQERGKMQQLMEQFLIEAAGQLNQEERQILADAMHGPPPPPPFEGVEGDFPPPRPPPPPPEDME